jgi:hypothetical protein
LGGWSGEEIGAIATSGGAIATGEGGGEGGSDAGGMLLDVSMTGPEREAKSSVAARFSSSALCDAPASEAAETALFSQTMAS